MPVSLVMTEAQLHKTVISYLKTRYKSAIFRTDFAAGIKMTVGQARVHKQLQSSRAYPDLFIAEPRGGYHGLFIELKREGTRVYLKDGNLSSDPHIQEQANVLQQLNSRQYYATFGIGFEMTKDIIDSYLLGAINERPPLLGTGL